jgi:NADPH:quinone reductase-like Zn-dependent oxidoreductase
VCANLNGIETKRPINGSFQLYCATTAKFVSKLPNNISYTQGAVLPLAISTAAAGLFQKGNMALPRPQIPPKPTDKVLLVWGGSSSVGSCAIQLAKGAGFEIEMTTSAHNHGYCTSLGAKYLLDHRKNRIVEDIVSALKGKDFGGVLDTVSKPDAITKNV